MMGYTIWPDGITGEVIEQVYRERLRQDELVVKGKFLWNCSARHRFAVSSDSPVTNAEKLSVLAEEFGEVAREVTEEIIAIDIGRGKPFDRKNLKKELIQVAAVCVAWAESL